MVSRSSSDWTRDRKGAWVRVPIQQTRGLNRNHNQILKSVFKGAATTVVLSGLDPLHGDYQRLVEAGTKPSLAKVTLARKLAAIVLSMWKNQEVYDPTKGQKSLAPTTGRRQNP